MPTNPGDPRRARVLRLCPGGDTRLRNARPCRRHWQRVPCIASVRATPPRNQSREGAPAAGPGDHRRPHKPRISRLDVPLLPPFSRCFGLNRHLAVRASRSRRRDVRVRRSRRHERASGPAAEIGNDRRRRRVRSSKLAKGNTIAVQLPHEHPNPTSNDPPPVLVVSAKSALKVNGSWRHGVQPPPDAVVVGGRGPRSCNENHGLHMPRTRRLTATGCATKPTGGSRVYAPRATSTTEALYLNGDAGSRPRDDAVTGGSRFVRTNDLLRARERAVVLVTRVFTPTTKRSQDGLR